MYNIIKIGETEVPMLALACVDLCYERIFHADPIKIQAAKDYGPAEGIELFQKMGFVMAEYAQRKSINAMAELTEDDYAEWLCQFDRGAYMTAIADVRATYEGQKVTYADPKPEADLQNAN